MPNQTGKGDIKWAVGDDHHDLLGDVMNDFQKAAEEEAARRAEQLRIKEEATERKKREEEERRQAEVQRRLQEQEERERRLELERQEQARRAAGVPEPVPADPGTPVSDWATAPPLSGPAPNIEPGWSQPPAAAPVARAGATQEPSREQTREQKGPSPLERRLQQQLDGVKRTTYLGLAIAGVLLVLALVMTIFWMGTSEEFEGTKDKLASIEQLQIKIAGELAEKKNQRGRIDIETNGFVESAKQNSVLIAQLEREVEEAKQARLVTQRTVASYRGNGSKPAGRTATAAANRPIELKIDLGKLGD